MLGGHGPAVNTSLSVPLSSPASYDRDDFVASCPGDTYAQSTLYSAVKQGHDARYVELREGGQLVAGAQMLLRPLGTLGALGYIANGPVLADRSAPMAERVVDATLALARRERVRALVLQPAESIATLDDALREQRFGPSPVEVATTCAIGVDLKRSEEELLARMRSGLRR